MVSLNFFSRFFFSRPVFYTLFLFQKNPKPRIKRFKNPIKQFTPEETAELANTSLEPTASISEKVLVEVAAEKLGKVINQSNSLNSIIIFFLNSRKGRKDGKTMLSAIGATKAFPKFPIWSVTNACTPAKDRSPAPSAIKALPSNPL